MTTERQAEIAYAKAMLWLLHELRRLGVKRQGPGGRHPDSWRVAA